jgi:hypothetical protein
MKLTPHAVQTKTTHIYIALYRYAMCTVNTALNRDYCMCRNIPPLSLHLCRTTIPKAIAAKGPKYESSTG